MAATHDRPEALLRARVILADAVGFAAIVAVAELAAPRVSLGTWYPIKAAALFMVVMAIVVVRIGGSHPFPRFGSANNVTTARAAIVALIGGLVGETVSPALAGVATAAGMAATVLDGVDGWLARRTGLASRFGARFDMEVDALLIMCLSILAWQTGKAGVWIILAGLLRYLFVAASWVFPRMNRALFPSVRRQAVCVIQVVGLSVVVAPLVEPPLSAWLSAGLLLILVWSFLVDTIWLWRTGD